MHPLDTIKAPIAQEMERFEDKFRQALKSDVALLDRIMYYIYRRKGKQMRPLLVFLGARLHGATTESTYTGAALVELMHTATLVHDDVVDNADYRRGFFSINALWKNKIAVLVGDFLLSKVLLLAVEKREFGLLELVSTSVKQMSEGELLQMEKARRLDIDEAIYYDIIRQKTASLMAACLAIGARSAGADDAMVQRMWDMGENLGMAFQIKDDLFDYESANKTGKPAGLDIREQKMTLPLIYTLQQTDSSTRKRMIATVKRHHDNPERVAEVIAWVKAHGGLEYATEKMKNYQAKAHALLSEIPGDTAVKTALSTLFDYVVARKK
jgi:octaprenyl-diphosphate synthase